eukprot:1210092-Rhodomonas_salina.2
MGASAKRSEHPVVASTSAVTAARCFGSPQPLIPPAAGSTTAPPLMKALPTPEPNPKEWHSVIDTHERSSAVDLSTEAAFWPSETACFCVIAAPL